MNILSAGNTDWSALSSQYANKRPNQDASKENDTSTDLSGSLSGVTAMSPDGDTIQISEAAAALLRLEDSAGDETLATNKLESVACPDSDTNGSTTDDSALGAENLLFKNIRNSQASRILYYRQT